MYAEILYRHLRFCNKEFSLKLIELNFLVAEISVADPAEEP
jgi:hypothetical protein